MILVYSKYLSPRLQYVCTELFERRYGIGFKHTDRLDYFEKSTSFRINYNNTIVEACLNIPPVDLLYEEHIEPQQIKVAADEKWKHVFFESGFESIPDFRKDTRYLEFDLFAAVFYLLSRYEEYLPSTRDEHGRYKENNSLAFKNGFLEYPLVDHWLNRFAAELKLMYPAITLAEPGFQQLNTIDIDFAYKYKGHSLSRLGIKAIGSVLRGKPDTNVLNPPDADPYDTYDTMIDAAKSAQIETLFFFLMADYGGYDKGHNPSSSAFADLIKKLAAGFTCGIHPSYKSGQQTQLLQKELEIFHAITGKHATISRNHFLKIKLPETYEKLEAAGITTDYSMAYSGAVGFRASTSRPFGFFNLSTNQAGSMLIQPACVMDVTLKNNMKLTPEKAIEKIATLKALVKKTKGMFVSIWHNSSFDPAEGWNGWDKVYRSLFEDNK